MELSRKRAKVRGTRRRSKTKVPVTQSSLQFLGYGENASRLLSCPYFSGPWRVRGILMSSVRVLVVDDHAGVRNMICSLLSQESTLNAVFQASNGEEAVTKADLPQPDFVLLDIGLQGITGLETARQIPRVSPQTKIIFLRQHDSLHLANEALKIGGHGYVSKMDAGAGTFESYSVRTVRARAS
jgi:CheY-like chemotaxis protein